MPKLAHQVDACGLPDAHRELGKISTIRSKITNAEPQPAGREHLQPCADALEVRPAGAILSTARTSRSQEARTWHTDTPNAISPRSAS